MNWDKNLTPKSSDNYKYVRLAGHGVFSKPCPAASISTLKHKGYSESQNAQVDKSQLKILSLSAECAAALLSLRCTCQ